MITAAPFHADVASAPPGAQAFWLTTSDGCRLRAAVWAGGDRGTAIVFPGRSEYIEKYGRVIGQLVARGLSVAAIDWRGQGLSDRHPKSPMLGHVEDFRDYQRDVAALIDLVADLDLPGPRYLVAHSMGGCIGLRTLLESAEFSGAILSAPMWHLRMKAATRELTSKMTQFAQIVGLGNRLTPGANPAPSALSLSFEGNALTTDREHFHWAGQQLTLHPDLALGGPSMGWTRAALEEMARLYVAPLPKLPVLVLLGTDETVVSSRVIRSQVAKMAKAELVICDRARHEIFMERPAVQKATWEAVDRFFDGLTGARRPRADFDHGSGPRGASAGA